MRGWTEGSKGKDRSEAEGICFQFDVGLYFHFCM